jgi:hypothetical protein
MHTALRYMWAKLSDGSSYDVVVTTFHHSHVLHGGTRVGIDAPVHGFALDGTLYLDPAGAYCEPAAGSSLRMRPSDTAFAAEYRAMGLLKPPSSASASEEAEVCLISGAAVTGVTRADATRLSSFLLREAAVTYNDLPGRERLPRPPRGHLKRAPTPPPRGLRADVGFAPALAAPRELGKTPFKQSAGTRTMLFIRIVWSDQSASDAISDAAYAAYTTSFVQYANNRSYGNMVLVPTYTPGCVYKIASHTSAEADTPGNGNSIGSWIFDGYVAALAAGPGGCAYAASSFDHVFIIAGALSQVDWAGLGSQPGKHFIVQASAPRVARWSRVGDAFSYLCLGGCGWRLNKNTFKIVRNVFRI